LIQRVFFLLCYHLAFGFFGGAGGGLAVAAARANADVPSRALAPPRRPVRIALQPLVAAAAP
jgi:hypothetical protein